jgi:hypothetical protein
LLSVRGFMLSIQSGLGFVILTLGRFVLHATSYGTPPTTTARFITINSQRSTEHTIEAPFFREWMWSSGLGRWT